MNAAHVPAAAAASEPNNAAFNFPAQAEPAACFLRAGDEEWLAMTRKRSTDGEVFTIFSCKR